MGYRGYYRWYLCKLDAKDAVMIDLLDDKWFRRVIMGVLYKP